MFFWLHAVRWCNETTKMYVCMIMIKKCNLILVGPNWKAYLIFELYKLKVFMSLFLFHYFQLCSAICYSANSAATVTSLWIFVLVPAGSVPAGTNHSALIKCFPNTKCYCVSLFRWLSGLELCNCCPTLPKCFEIEGREVGHNTNSKQWRCLWIIKTVYSCG